MASESSVAEPAPCARGGASGRSLLNRALAFLFLLPAGGILAVIYVLFLVAERRRAPFFYRGIRLGLHRRPYTIYKVRTLREDAEKQVGAALLSPKSGLERPLGRLLRASRMDELPQLINILRGDMEFLGPRPLRPVAYERLKSEIPDYDQRFGVFFEAKPGLTGFSQLYTAYAAPKRLRYAFDRHLASRQISVLRYVGLVFGTALLVALRLCRAVWQFLRDRPSTVASQGQFSNKRMAGRVRCRRAWVCFPEDAPEALAGRRIPLRDINCEAFSCRCAGPLLEQGLSVAGVRLVTESSYFLRGSKRKTMRCAVRLYRSRDIGGYTQHVFFYEPASRLDRYLVDQYLLRDTIA